MDESVTIKQLRDEARCFAEERNWGRFHTPRNLAESIVIEASELLAEFQWDNQFGNPINIKNISDELSDVFIFCLTMASGLNIDISESIFSKMARNAEKYPIESIRACHDGP